MDGKPKRKKVNFFYVFLRPSPPRPPLFIGNIPIKRLYTFYIKVYNDGGLIYAPRVHISIWRSQTFLQMQMQMQMQMQLGRDSINGRLIVLPFFVFFFFPLLAPSFFVFLYFFFSWLREPRRVAALVALVGSLR